MKELNFDGLEVVKPDYLHPEFEPRFALKRYDRETNRYYFREEGGTLMPYMSVTSFAREVIPPGPGLIKWMMSKGVEAEYIKQRAALFGTLFHAFASEVLIHGTFNFDTVSERMYEFFPKKYHEDLPKLQKPMKMGVASVIQFVQERVVDVYAIELPLCHDEYRIAGTIDLVAKVNYNRKERIAIMDFKSFSFGESGNQVARKFYDAHEFQLAVLMELWNYNYPDNPATEVFNWAPKKWKKKPTYSWERQTTSRFMDSVKLYIDILNHRGLFKPPTEFFDIKGQVKDIMTFDIQSHMVKVPIK